MSLTRQHALPDVLVRFWSLDHHRAEEIFWPASPWAKLVFAARGTVRVETANRMHVLPCNRALVVPVDAAHPARTLGPAEVRTLYFASPFRLDRSLSILTVRPLLRELIRETCTVGPLVRGNPHHEALAHLLEFEINSAGELPTSIPTPSSPWLKKWVEAFFADPTLRPESGFSRRTLERHFIAETGLTLGQWCQQARGLLGLQALSSGSTVQEAAVTAGFETTSGFIQSFRRQFGATPGKAFVEMKPEDSAYQ